MHMHTHMHTHRYIITKEYTYNSTFLNAICFWTFEKLVVHGHKPNNNTTGIDAYLGWDVNYTPSKEKKSIRYGQSYLTKQDNLTKVHQRMTWAPFIGYEMVNCE
jgi:hypothetical protein